MPKPYSKAGGRSLAVIPGRAWLQTPVRVGVPRGEASTRPQPCCKPSSLRPRPALRNVQGPAWALADWRARASRFGPSLEVGSPRRLATQARVGAPRRAGATLRRKLKFGRDVRLLVRKPPDFDIELRGSSRGPFQVSLVFTFFLSYMSVLKFMYVLQCAR